VRKKNITPEDRELFRQSVGTVKSIKSDRITVDNGKKPKPIPRTQTAEVENVLNHEIGVTELLSLEDTLSFISAGLQKNVLKKLRHGNYGLDAEIDLHGLTSQEAKRQLLDFLHRAVQEGCRCVCIVHGKGYRSPDNHPILKNNLNLWLRQHKEVQAFCSAPPRQGGTGAVFVLLQLAEKFNRLEETTDR
jgi:DNA-nicking Smr family endonuclease